MKAQANAAANETKSRPSDDRTAVPARRSPVAISAGRRGDAKITPPAAGVGNQALLRMSRGGRLSVQMRASRGGMLQRNCACGGSAGISGECAECREKREATLQRASGGAAPGTVPPIVHEVLRSPGKPLDHETRAFMEPRFRQDFSGVRVYTDSKAAESARAVNALAYTVGHSIVFAAAHFAPERDEGRRLLAHELVHTLQQGGAAASSSRLSMSPAESESEREAEWMSAAVIGDDSRLEKAPISAVAVKCTGPECAGSAVLQRTCRGHPNRTFYETAENYCRDTPATGQLHPGQTCFREVPKRSSYLECPAADQVCFDGEGHCFDSWDEASPVESKEDDGTCNLHFACSMAHAWKDKVVQTWLDQQLEELGRTQLECMQTCRALPWYAQGLCFQSCSGAPP